MMSTLAIALGILLAMYVADIVRGHRCHPLPPALIVAGFLWYIAS